MQTFRIKRLKNSRLANWKNKGPAFVFARKGKNAAVRYDLLAR